MKKQWIVVAAVMMIVLLGALEAAAQDPGPQGAGAEKTAGNSHTPHSYNPIKWMKKDPNTATQKPKKVKNKKHSAKPANPNTPAPPPGA